jgi:hypothetical protein
MKKINLILSALFLMSILPLVSADCNGVGGVLTMDGDYCVHTFLSNDTFNVANPINVEILIVAGGGGGGNTVGGGGGAGGLIYNSSYIVSSGNYPVVVGEGGSYEDGGHANNGSYSSFDSLIAIGGGASGSWSGGNGWSGGSGGGGSGSATSGGLGGTGLQGYSGGAGFSGSSYAGGGGGGFSSAGQDGTADTGGNGGNGINFSISGTDIYYAGGGGGGGNSVGGLGGLGGGGDGGYSNGVSGVNGVANTGGGGGGTRDLAPAGNGGSGIVIIRYLSSTANATISIDYPYNITYNSVVDNLNYIVSDAQSCWYSTDLGVTNNTINCGENVTGLNANNTGSYTWIVYANNSINNIVSDSVTFNVLLLSVPYRQTYSTNQFYCSTTDCNFGSDGNYTSYTGFGDYWNYNYTLNISITEQPTYVNLTTSYHTNGDTGILSGYCYNTSNSEVLMIFTVANDCSTISPYQVCNVTESVPTDCIDGNFLPLYFNKTTSGYQDTQIIDNRIIYEVVNIPSPSPSPSPSVTQESILSNVLTSSGEGLGGFLTLIRNPLVGIVLNVTVVILVAGIIFSFAIWIIHLIKIRNPK